MCGPTAAGKSAVAMYLATLRPTTIVSADSRQIYRGFDVGTAKPSVADLARVPHRGIDIIDPAQRYTAAAWVESAACWIDEAYVAGTVPVVVGGTGMYLRALFDGLFAEPPLDERRRRSLDATLGTMSVAELRRWVDALDPPRSHLGRTQLLRAVEIALLTGRRMSDLHRETVREPRWRARYLLVDPGPALAGRIAARIDDMLDHGWPEEVQRLMGGVPPDAPAWNAAGYAAVRDWIGGRVTRAGAIERILIETRQYAKRQRTWFRHQVPSDRVTHVNPLDEGWPIAAREWAAR
ncbi:MAG TPA: tRNA (adenosine(37)-N6)-dimethylallyltransferase MiaA [Gemmatimonadaceae bacterium]|nr:tRNA (adenosine(37)-N6)-dimethylallyltransferase MiaA [Gemmatimonadaceae bacterium]